MKSENGNGQIIDTGRDGNSMPIKMFKILFPHTKIIHLKSA